MSNDITTGGLQGRIILITGASSGIGRETALLLASQGARLALSDINEPDGRDLCEQISTAGGEAHFFPADVANHDSVKQLHDAVATHFGNIDCAINNAGVEHLNMRLADCTEEMWDHTLNVNLKGVWLCMKYQILLMQESGGGHIINMSSVAGLRSAASLAPYAASKHGVIGLTKTAAAEYATDNIRVNVVCPSFIRTPMVARAMASNEKVAAFLEKSNPMKRVGEPREVAEVIAWLCSDASSFMTGNALPVDGGMCA